MMFVLMPDICKMLTQVFSYLSKIADDDNMWRISQTKKTSRLWGQLLIEAVNWMSFKKL